MTLRPYQQESLKELLLAYHLPGNDLVVIPAGGGKSHIIAAFAKAINEPILILQPTRELILQNKSKLEAIIGPNNISVYSASLKSKKVAKFTYGTIQSVIKHPEIFTHVKVVIVDECDLINVRNLNTQYRQLVFQLNNPKVIGFTATPYRMATRYKRWGKLPWQLISYVVTELINRVFPVFWDRVVYQISHQELVDQGYLVPLTYVDKTVVDHEQIPTNKTKSDFDLLQWHENVGKCRSWDSITAEIKETTVRFGSVLIFAATVGEAGALQAVLPGSAVLTSLTKPKERLEVIRGLREGKLKILINVQILTVGFDHPPLDCIIFMRPTKSFRLYQQILSRGSRIYPGKETCTVFDYSGTVKALGPIESIRIEKVNGKWELLSSTGSWNNRELYRWTRFSVPRYLRPAWVNRGRARRGVLGRGMVK